MIVFIFYPYTERRTSPRPKTSHVILNLKTSYVILSLKTSHVILSLKRGVRIPFPLKSDKINQINWNIGRLRLTLQPQINI